MTSELFMIFKEETNIHNRNSLIRRAKFYIDLIVDLCRILETVTRWAPEVFLAKELINSNRLIEYMIFVLKSVFKSEMDKSIAEFCSLIPSRTRNLAQMLSPFVGILTNL